MSVLPLNDVWIWKLYCNSHIWIFSTLDSYHDSSCVFVNDASYRTVYCIFYKTTSPGSIQFWCLSFSYYLYYKSLLSIDLILFGWLLNRFFDYLFRFFSRLLVVDCLSILMNHETRNITKPVKLAINNLLSFVYLFDKKMYINKFVYYYKGFLI